MNINEVNIRSGQVVDAAMKVHSALGPGLLESAYEACLAHELRRRGLRVLVRLPLPVVYAGVRLELGFKADLLVDDVVIVMSARMRRAIVSAASGRARAAAPAVSRAIAPGSEIKPITAADRLSTDSPACGRLIAAPAASSVRAFTAW